MKKPKQKIEWIGTVTREASLPVEIHDLEGERDYFLKKLGAGIKNKIYFPKDDKHTFFFCKREWGEFARTIIGKIKTDRDWLRKETDNIYKICKEWLKVFKTISKARLSKINNKELYKYYDRYGSGRRQFSFCLYTPLIIERFLEEEIRNKLEDELRSKNRQDLFEKYWGIITTKIPLNAIDEEKIDLLKIAIKYKKKKKIDKEIDSLLKNHTEKFCWLPHYALSLPIWTKAYFTKNLKIIRNPKRDFKNILRKIKKDKKALNKIKQECKDNGELKRLINFMQEYLYLRTYRTDILRQAFYHIMPFLKEITKRTKLKFNDVLFLTPYEIQAFLLNNIPPDLKEIKRRQKHYTIVMKNGVIKVISDEKELTRIKKALEEKIKVKTLKGNVAFSGIVRGRVRVIKTIKDISKLKRGEILVTAMTTPDMTIAIHKAVGIVTDEGGITCHAAICSRELKIPCVIATKNATKVLKDRDLVEVDAEKGIVKILEKVE